MAKTQAIKNQNTPPVIHLEDVSKRFSFVQEKPQSLLESFISWFTPRKNRDSTKKDLWAVKDVNLAVQPGQCLGIVGRNGSGKSTLLKLITPHITPHQRHNIHSRPC